MVSLINKIMSEVFLYDKLVILNNIYNNTILPSKTISQPNVIKTPLLQHQNLLINAMHAHRDKMTRGFVYNGQIMNGKLGIIGDPPGSGKTLSILSYLASEIHRISKVTCELVDNSTRYFFSNVFNDTIPNRTANLIIVPHYLFSYWKQQIEIHTNLKYVAIETRRNIRGDNLIEEITNSTFVLTTSKCYKYIQQYAMDNNIKWDNIFIDEATTIYMSPSDPPLNFQFLWFITSNWLPLIFKPANIIKSDLYHIRNRIHQIHPDLDKWLCDPIGNYYEGIVASSAFLKIYLPYYHSMRSVLVLRNSNDIIMNSINIKQYTENIVTCRPNMTLLSLLNYFRIRDIEPHISQENIIKAFQALSVPMNTLESYLLEQPTNKHTLIRKKIEENECVICLEKCEYPTIVNCCCNIYCASCLIKNMLITHKCPTCRDVLYVKDINCFYKLQEIDIPSYNTKVETCLDILRNNRNGRFIIYASFDSIYYQVYNDFDKLGIKAERIESNLFSLLKTIKNFNEGTTQILFVSNIDLIRGLSLTSASHLIFLHEQPSYELRQILIHSAQRIGRKNPLQIVNLTAEIPV